MGWHTLREGGQGLTSEAVGSSFSRAGGRCDGWDLEGTVLSLCSPPDRSLHFLCLKCCAQSRQFIPRAVLGCN